jgi:hypothetical protein
LAELITFGGAFKFLSLIAGFPSYASLVGVLGVTGLGKKNYIKAQHSHTRTISVDQLHKSLKLI